MEMSCYGWLFNAEGERCAVMVVRSMQAPVQYVTGGTESLLSVSDSSFSVDVGGMGFILLDGVGNGLVWCVSGVTWN